MTLPPPISLRTRHLPYTAARVLSLGTTRRRRVVAPPVQRPGPADLPYPRARRGATPRRATRTARHRFNLTCGFRKSGFPRTACPASRFRFSRAPAIASTRAPHDGRRRRRQQPWRRRLLRHEAGHALDTAYGLRKRADWRRIFGRRRRVTPATTRRTEQRRHVLHLGHWYAQSHPTEDFAETFAVWLQPKARWRRDYAEWPAHREARIRQHVMDEIAGSAPSSAIAAS